MSRTRDVDDGASNGCWSDARSAITEAVRRAGRGARVFGYAEIWRELDPAHGFMQPSAITLRRVLRMLEDAVMVRLPASVTLLVAPAHLPRVTAPRGAPRFVLTGQVMPRTSVELLDDVGRALLALHVAMGAVDGRAVPTRLVTEALSIEPRLALTSTQQTAVLLDRLCREFPSLVSREVAGGRSARWRVGEALLPHWQSFVDTMVETHASALGARAARAKLGAASGAQLVARLVEAVAGRAGGRRWPKGRPVSAQEIAEYVAGARAGVSGHDGEDDLVSMADALVRRKGDLTAALQAATRLTYSDGSTPRAPEVRIIAHRDLTTTWYAPRSMAPAVSSAWVLWRRVRELSSPARLALIAAERVASRVLLKDDDVALHAVGAIRVVLARAQLQEVVGLVTSMGEEAFRVSHGLEASRHQIADHLDGLLSRWPDRLAAERAARTALRPLGLQLDDVVNAVRPTISQSQFAACAPAYMRDGLTAGMLAANAVTVRRQRVVDGRTRVGSGRVPNHRLDRVDALCYLADNASLPARRAFEAGSRLLGPWLASARLLRPLFRHDLGDVRAAALGAAVLLDARRDVEKEFAWRRARLPNLTRGDRIDMEECEAWLTMVPP